MKIKKPEYINPESSDNELDEIRKLIKKKELQNTVLKKIIEKTKESK